jgi:hypothetical protein
MLALALVLLLTAAAYFLVTTHADLFPCNNVRDAKRSEQVAEVLVNAPLMTLPAALLGVSAPWATAGAGVSWPELHARTYARTVIVLPRIGDRPRPNLEHMVLHALMLAAGICALAAAGAL